MIRFTIFLSVTFCNFLITTNFALPFEPESLSKLLPNISPRHESGGEEYVVILADNAPRPNEILERINLSPEHIDVRHVFNNSAFRGFSANMNSHCIDALRKMDDVLHVESTVIATSHSSIVEQTIRPNSPWGLQRISSTSAPFGSSKSMSYTYTYASNSTLGSGVDIYIVDTGINTANIVFGGHARMGYSFSPDFADNDGHGTHVSGTAAGYVFGVASGASLIGVKVLGDDGSGSTSDVLGGMDYVITQHDTRQGQDPSFLGSVMSMSWGLQAKSQVIQTAVAAALGHGIHVSMAAGNDAADACAYSPSAAGGAASAAISVGSIGPSAEISSFSNTGSCVDIYAPGEDVLSAWIGGDNVVQYLSGTSMACPHVTGVMAYLIAGDESGTLANSPSALKAKLLSMSLKWVVQGDAVEDDARLLLNNGMVGRAESSGVRLDAKALDVRSRTRREAFRRRDPQELVSSLLWKGKMSLANDGKALLRF